MRYVLEELLAWVVRLSGDVNPTECRHMALIYLDWLQKVSPIIFMHTLFWKVLLLLLLQLPQL